MRRRTSREFYARAGVSLRGEEIAARADAGDAHALASLDAYRDRLARALASVVNIVDPDVIVLGGGLSNISRLYDGLERLVEHYAFSDALETKVARNVHGASGGGPLSMKSPPIRSSSPRKLPRRNLKRSGEPGSKPACRD